MKIEEGKYESKVEDYYVTLRMCKDKRTTAKNSGGEGSVKEEIMAKK